MTPGAAVSKGRTMATSPMADLVRQLRRRVVLRDGAGSTDGELLEAFVSRHDGAALATLVQRHATMVWGVCRRILRNDPDAEDAFQATFLVLVRRATSVTPRGMVANWLYGVAHRTALKARGTVRTRRGRERQVVEMPEPGVTEPDRCDELLPALDEELARLPDRYRAVIVLCDLEGNTRKEAARQLGVPEGTVAGWVARARVLLANRLTQRGVTLSGGALAAVLSETVAAAGVPALVLSNTIRAVRLLAAGQAVAGTIPVKVAALTEGVMKAMLMTKLKTIFAVVLALGFVATGAVILTSRTAAGQDDKKPPAEKPVEQKAKQRKQKQDEETFTAWGEELPGGVRIGLGYLPGGKRVYITGESVTLVVRARNVGSRDVNLEYVRDLWINYPPAVVDGDGAKYPMPKVITDVIQFPSQVALNAGKEAELYRMKLELRPAGERDDERVMMIFGTGKFQIREEYGLIGRAWVGGNRADAADRTLPSGKLELEVRADPPVAPDKANPEIGKAPPKQDNEHPKQAVTAWGKEAGGLQAGLEFLPGERRAYRQGETVTLVVRVRNVGKEAVTFEYVKQFLDENRPAVTDGKGKAIPQSGTSMLGFHIPVKVTLEPGKEIVLETRMHGSSGSPYKLRPATGETEPGTKAWPLVVSTGKVGLQYERVIGNSSSGFLNKLDPALSKLATGKLELEVLPPDDDEKKPPRKQDRKPVSETFTLKNVTIDDVDEKAGTISVRFGDKEKPTKLVNVPLDKGVRVVASHVLPGTANNLPFEWAFVERLKGKTVSVRLVRGDGLSVVSIASGND